MTSEEWDTLNKILDALLTASLSLLILGAVAAILIFVCAVAAEVGRRNEAARQRDGEMR